jgi:two-component system, LytTR family, sensor kinase
VAPFREPDFAAATPWRDGVRPAGARALLARAGELLLLSFVFWGGVVLLMTTRKYVARRIVWPPAYFGRMLHGLAPDYLGYALLTPVVWLVATRLPVLGRDARTRRNLWVHAGIGLLFSLAVSAITAGVDDTLFPTAPGVPPPPWSVRTGYLFAIHFCDDLVVYAGVVLTALAVSYYQAYRAREIRAAQLEARLSQARLEALRSQIQPHFLFNTLHSISARMSLDVPGARKMIADLKALLRLSVERSDAQEVTLAAELEFLEQYVSIQRTRFRDRLTLD